MTNQEKAIYRKALHKFGVQSQVCMYSEESSELNKELMKYLRSNMHRDATPTREEIADTLVMVDQLMLIFGEKEVLEWKKIKLKRLNDIATISDPLWFVYDVGEGIYVVAQSPEMASTFLNQMADEDSFGYEPDNCTQLTEEQLDTLMYCSGDKPIHTFRTQLEIWMRVDGILEPGYFAFDYTYQ